VHKVKLQLKEGAVPVYVDLVMVACTSCDPILRNDLNFPPIKLTQPTTSGQYVDLLENRTGCLVRFLP